MVKKKWLVPPAIIAILVASFGVVLAVDLDDDEVNGWDELFIFGSNPFAFNSAMVYADYIGIDDAEIVNMFLSLEPDGLDDSDIEFMDSVSGLEESSQHKIVNYFLEDKQLASEEKKLIETIGYLS